LVRWANQKLLCCIVTQYYALCQFVEISQNYVDSAVQYNDEQGDFFR